MSDDVVRIMVRGFIPGRRIFEDRIEASEDKIDALVQAAAERHATEMSKYPLHMIEIEFVDDPNPEARFFRFGTDPSMLVVPLRMGAPN